MISCLEPFTVATLSLLGELSNTQRLRSAAQGLRTSGATGTVLKWFVIGLVAAGVAVGLTYLVQWLSPRRKWRRDFQALGAKSGLDEAQMKVLSHMAKALEMTDASGLFTSQSVFDQGVITLMQHDSVMALPANARAEFAGVLEAIRRALGFTQFGARTTEDITSTRQISPSTAVQLILDDEPEPIDLQVKEMLAVHIAIGLDRPVSASSGQVARLRVPCGPVVWEFDVRVIDVTPERIVFDHSDSVRMINRRRFPRVATAVRAYVAALPFIVNRLGYQMPEFIEAEVEEVAGPGMLLLGTWRDFSHGDKVLLAIQFSEETTLQGLAKVRRVEPLADGVARVAVEMISLSTNEMAELVRQTNHAMTVKPKNSAAPSEDLQPVEEQAWTV